MEQNLSTGRRALSSCEPFENSLEEVSDCSAKKVNLVQID
jgi:hypothetical protein